MQIIPIDHLVVAPNRQRQELDQESLTALARSIKEAGLLHAVVVREQAAVAPENAAGTPPTLVLVAGERRLRAVRHCHGLGWPVRHDGHTVPADHIPVVTLGELSAIQAEEAELEENVKRKDLSWQERAAAEARLHALRSKQATARDGGGSIQTIAATAQEIHGRSDGAFQDQVRTNVLIAKHLDDPEIAKAANAKDALKILKRREETAANVERAKVLGEKTASELHTCLNTDSLHWMGVTIDAKFRPMFDVILTDPPYGIDAQDFSDSGGKLVKGSDAHVYDDSYESWLKLMRTFTHRSFQVAKDNAHLYAFCDVDRFAELKSLLAQVGWRVHRTPLIWHKPQATRVPWPDYGPRRHYELICYAVKGDRKVNYIGPDVISCPSDDNLGHGAQKPVALYAELLKRSASAGDTVLDPFAGTGTIFPAAHSLKVLATGIEQNPAYYAIAADRLSKLK